MKTNKILIILLLTAAMAFCGALAACQPQEEQFTVTFISEGEQFHSYTAEKGSEVQFPESQPQKAEDEQYTYQFVGWSLSEGGVTVQSHTVTQNVTFYAVFEAHEKQPPAPVEYTVTFIDGVTQQVLKTEKVPAGGNATAPQAPQHVGYEFSRWQGNYQNVTARTDVTAVYVQKQYTLVRHYLGKQVTQTLHYGDAIPAESLESPVGLNFLGWFADSDCTQPVSEVYPDGMPDAERAVEVYAGYEVDLSSAVINLPANPVYGDSVTLSLPNTENVAFSYKWQTAAGAMEGASFSFEGAGSQTVTAVVTANYMDGLVITKKTLSATAKVAKRPLQITLDVEKEIIYGQTAQPVVTVTGLLERDSELKNNVTADIVCDGDKLAVGQYSVTVTAHGLDNYSYTLPSASLTVKRAPLKVTVSANNVTYGEEADVNYSVTGFVYGEDESVLKGTMVVMLNNVVYTGGILQCGSYTVTVGGATADNYSVQGGEAEFEVTKRTASVTLSANNVTYGNEPQVTFSHSGFIAEDADKISLDFTFDGKLTVGSHTVTATITDEYINKNYNTQVTGAQFSVAKATLQVTVTAQNVTYGQNPAVSYDVTGFADGEDDGVLDGSIVYTYQKDSENYTQSVFTVGNYTVTASGLSADNYDFNYTQASFKVSKKQVTVTVSAQDVTFGQSADVSFTVGKLAFEDTQQALGNLAVQILKDGEPYYGYEQSKLLAAGRYTATVTGFNNDNYDVQVQQDEFTVQKATFTVTANMQGAADASLSYTVPEQFGIFTFKGTFYLTNTDEGVYEATDETSFNNYFAWQNGYAITATETGEDVTANFRLAYDVTFTLTASDFVITLPSQTTVVYTGKSNSYGITVQDADQIEGLSVTYAVKKDGTLSQFTETVPELTYAGQYTVYYRVSAPGYKTQEDSFTVTVQKATPTIYVPKQATEFTYTGERQYFNADGVTWSSREDGAELAIESFSFVTVAEGDGKQIKITSTATANYLSAEITVTLTVRKAQFTLSDGTYVGSFDGTYCGDAVNYNPADVIITFTARKQKVTVSVEGVSRKIGDVESDDGLFTVTAQGENGALSAEEIEVLSVSVSHGINFDVGGTYDVTYTLGQNDYYDAAFENGEKEIASWFKLCSVLYDNTWYTLQDALKNATSGTVIVAANTVASNSSAYCGDAYYTVKKGVTLLVPYDKDHSTNTKDIQRCYENGVSVPAVGTAYRTLTLPAGVTLLVAEQATLIVNAKVVSASAPVTGIVYGSNFGQLEVQKDAQVVVSGTFECIGFTYGEGSVTVNSGAYLYELFNMIAYKGGTNSLSLKNKLFPLNQYTLTSLSCQTTFVSGSNYNAKAFVTGKLLWVMDQNADVQFVSNGSDAFIQMNSEDASVVKRICEKTGRTYFDCYGDVILNNITLSLGIYAFDTAGLPVPVPGHFSITVHGNASMAKETQIKLLPGAQLTVEKGATLTVEGSDSSVKGGLSSYDGNAAFDSGVTQWKDGTDAYPIAQFKTVYRTAPTPDYSAATPAVILVKGTLKVSSTAYFAGVVTGEEGGIVELAEGAATTVTLNEILSGSDTYTATLNAILKGANTINQVTAGTYTYTDGSWVLKPAA